MNYFITGDTHRNFNRFGAIGRMPNTAIIILGDAGINFTLDKDDYDFKRSIARKYTATFYCVRGNHEARPGDIEGMKLVWDDNVQGEVWMEDEFPTIRYFKDWGVYHIDGLRTLVIGGAYSVDKHYRLARGAQWFENEQLSVEERAECARMVLMRPQFDLVLSHTCPRSLQPTDFFLGSIDQSLVDSSTEDWMEQLARRISWKVWLWGHYHVDRIEWPHCEIFYNEIEPLPDILARWKKYDETKELDWWLPLSPRMKRIMEDENEVV